MAATGSLFERLREAYYRLQASERFRRWAARFPPTRPIARRRARALFDLTAGFVYSQVLLAGVRLRLFERLHRQGPSTAEALAPALGLGLDATSRLLDAAVALRLARRESAGRYGLGALGAAIVDNAAVIAMVEHHDAFYADLADPVALLRDGKGRGALARYWAYATSAEPQALGAEAVATYSALMAASQPLVATQLLDAWPLTSARCLLDVGGGDGAFAAAVARRYPGLRLMLFDLPAVAERARARLAAEGLAHRVDVHAGSFRTDPLPAGADVITLVRVLHDHDDDTVRTILAAARRALPPDGELLIAEPMAGTPGAEVVGDAYFGLYLLAMGSGRARTPERLGALLAESGFDRGRLIPTPLSLQTRLLVARPRL